jgi:DNA polymerase
MNRRDLVLEEMGLGPRWRLRGVAAAETVPAPIDSREAAAGGPDAPLDPAHAAPPQSLRTPGVTSERLCVEVAEPVAGFASAPAPAGDAGMAAQADLPSSSPVMPEQRREAILQMDWAGLRTAVAQCVECPLHAKRTNTVFGVGDERASWLFVGEGPGADEDAVGEPFVGQAGRLLDNMLAAMGLKRGEDVYIANVVKCRPPNNRNPDSAEMSCCEPYLARQIELIRPRLIVALGKIAASHLLQTNVAVASLRGRVHDYRGTPLIVTYHPAYLLRTLPDKAKAWADLCFAQDRMAAIVATAAEAQRAR